MIDLAIRARLLAVPAITAIVGDQIKAQKGDEGGYPLITYWQVAAGADDTTPMTGTVNIFRTIQQVEFYASSRGQLLDLMRLTREALDGFNNQTWGGLDIRSSRFQDQADREHQSGPDVYWSWQQYRIVLADN